MSESIWVAPRLTNGLGNRLFQAVAAIRVAEQHGIEPVFLLPRMSSYEHGNFSLLLKLFPSIRILETAPEWNDYGETNEEKIPDVSLTKPLVLLGYFQNSENFPSLTNPNLPRLPTPNSKRPGVWAIHFRLGDYCILPHHQIHELNKYYYQIIKKYIPSGQTIVLFSDSPQRLEPMSEEIKSLGYNTEIFTSTDTLETLQAFSACQGGAVCGNSTFAWWSAYFAFMASNQDPNYKAYFPHQWLRYSPRHRVFTLPFTQVIELNSLPAFPYLKSFSY
jgi:hypothetical protein